MKRVISFILIFVIIVSMSNTFVFAVESNDNRKSFIDFYATKDSSILSSAQDLSPQDYYTFGVFASNFFEPGLTTLADLLDGSYENSEFFKNFVDSMGRKGDADFEKMASDILSMLANDIQYIINSGTGTLYYKEGSKQVPLSGGDLLKDMGRTILWSSEDVLLKAGGEGVIETLSKLQGISEEETKNLVLETSNYAPVETPKTNKYNYKAGDIWPSKYYINDGVEKLAVTLDSDVFRASFITLSAYNPKLFISQYGIEKMGYLIVDQMGNIWGIDVKQNGTNLSGIIEYAGNGDLKEGAKHVYLIMPACLNPATFSVGVENFNDLKYPLMNRFSLSCLLSQGALNADNADSKSLHNSYIPFYNILSEGTGNFTKAQNQMLTIFGVTSLTSNILDSEKSIDDIMHRRNSMGCFMYNPDLITYKVSKNISENQNILPTFASNSFIVLSPNVQHVLSYLDNTSTFIQNNFITDDVEEDGRSTYNSIFDMSSTLSGNWSMSVFYGEYIQSWLNEMSQTYGYGYGDAGFIKQKVLQYQQRLLVYLFTPIALHLNQVSMDLYLTSADAAYGSDEPMKEVISDIYDGGDIELSNGDSIEGKVWASMGMKGFSVFFSAEGNPFTLKDSETYLCVKPDNCIHSRFAEELLLDMDVMNPIYYNNIMDGNYEFLKDINMTAYHIFKSYETLTIENNEYRKDWKKPVKYDTPTRAVKHKFSTGVEVDDYAGNDIVYYSRSTTDDDWNYYTRIIPHHVVGLHTENDGVREYSFHRLISMKEDLLRRVTDYVTTNDFFGYSGFETVFNGENTTKGMIRDFSNSIIRGTESWYIKYVLTQYAYSIFLPSDQIIRATSGSSGSYTSTFKLCGSNEDIKVGYSLTNFNGSNSAFLMGMYFGYIVDMCGMHITSEGITFSEFKSNFLPYFRPEVKGQSLSYSDSELNGREDDGGVWNSDDTSFEQKQKDLINRIYGLTNDKNNEYRNSLIKSILEGFFLTLHRTITGTWGAAASNVTTGSSTTYQSVTGYIYTPTLEELSFTATLMNNYIKIYLVCMILILFFLILMTLLNMRTWQQSLLIGALMFVVMLFPYILISNSISIANSISDSIYSDRFDFWALMEHKTSVQSLSGLTTMSEKEQILAVNNATTNLNNSVTTGVKLKWMSPKKVDAFQTLYTDKSLSNSFVTNVQIFKWLFRNFIYDSEFVDTDVYGAFVYRAYTSLANEAKSYYAWGKRIEDLNGFALSTNNTDNTIDIDGYTFNTLPKLFVENLGYLKEAKINYLASAAYLDKNYYLSGRGRVDYTSRYSDIKAVSYKDFRGQSDIINHISLWGDLSDEVSRKIGKIESIPILIETDNNNNSSYLSAESGIISNLPMTTLETSFNKINNPSEISKAIFLKNTESPYYYFYSVLKAAYSEYGDNSLQGHFNKQLLYTDIYRVSFEEQEDLNTDRNVVGAYRDFLNLEGLFTNIIPYLADANNYVSEWQRLNGSDVEDFDFDYTVDEGGNVDIKAGNDTSVGYNNAVYKKNAMNKVWNMYSPWVDSLYDLGVFNKRVSVGGTNVYILDTLNPSSYLEAGRPMIFSEADMIVKGYNYSQLTDVEKRIQAVLEKTYKDMLYLVNYYDMDSETDSDVLLSAAAMYATFNFNTEFSKKSFLGESIMLYPQGFELRNFNYDAFMRLALLNATGENIFDETDLYSRVLSKTSVFTGLFLIICDLIACVLIPALKFVIIVALLFLGLLLCVTLVINPPEKIFGSIMKSVVLPTFLFMVLNIGFSWIMSLIVGEGLTAYVGSKSVNFATNDPTMTMVLMAFLGVVYVIIAIKIIKMIIASYKEFGMSTILGAVNVVGSAGRKAIGRIGAFAAGAVGGAAGAVMAGVAGRSMVEGATLGVKGNIKRNWYDKQMRRNMAAATMGSQGSQKFTDDINSKASSMGTSNPTSGASSMGTSNPTSGTSSTSSVSSNVSRPSRSVKEMYGQAQTKLSNAVGTVKSKVKDVGARVTGEGGLIDRAKTFSGEKLSAMGEGLKSAGAWAKKNITLENAVTGFEKAKGAVRKGLTYTKDRVTDVGACVANSGKIIRKGVGTAKDFAGKTLSDVKAGLQLTGEYIGDKGKKIGKAITSAPKNIGAGMALAGEQISETAKKVGSTLKAAPGRAIARTRHAVQNTSDRVKSSIQPYKQKMHDMVLSAKTTALDVRAQVNADVADSALNSAAKSGKLRGAIAGEQARQTYEDRAQDRILARMNKDNERLQESGTKVIRSAVRYSQKHSMAY